jgi:pSer/pThr/pTyr-binding forkhead associated (FHA) protein
MKLSLVVTQGNPEGKEIPIRLSQFLIGRDPECHLRPGSPLVSKRHAAILVRDGKVFLRDFDSTNGTILNAAPLKGEVELKDGDEVVVGPLGFRVKISATAQDTPKPATVTVAEKAAAAAKPAPQKAAPKPVAAQVKSSDSNVNEDSVMEMLLNLEGDAGGGAGSSGDPIPPGSTIMQMIASGAAAEEAAEAEKAAAEKKAEEKKPEKKKIQDTQATSNAAKAILDKYMRRPRG